MEQIKFKNPDLQKKYEERMRELQKIVNSPALTQEVLWDTTAAKYAETIARIQRLAEEKELKSQFPERLNSQMNAFLDKCMNPEFHIALVGAIKAGKSSLINAMLGVELASTEVTPETASLTKFKRSHGKDYIVVSFYNRSEWDALWRSTNGVKDSAFMREYRELNADAERQKWVDHPDIRVECDTKEKLKETIRQYTSSQSAAHYFVKEVIVGLEQFDFPDGVLLVDTPGLDDVVEYRSNITKDYIVRADAVLVCVKADSLTGSEFATITEAFQSAGNKPEKVYIIATQQDSLNEPVKDWKKQRVVWLKLLIGKSCYKDKNLAKKNLIPTSGYLYTLLINRNRLDDDREWAMQAAVMKMKCKPDQIQKNLDSLLAFTNISYLKDTLDREIVFRARELKLEDIKIGYDTIKKAAAETIREIRENQKNLIDVSKKTLDELDKLKRQNDKELTEAENDQRELTQLAADLKKQTHDITNRMISSIHKLNR